MRTVGQCYVPQALSRSGPSAIRCRESSHNGQIGFGRYRIREGAVAWGKGTGAEPRGVGKAYEALVSFPPCVVRISGEVAHFQNQVL